MTGPAADILDPSWHAFDDLVRFETVLWNRVDEALRAEAALTLGDLTVMTVVAGIDNCRVSDLMRALAISVGGASQAADRVVRRGLCERRAHPADARASVLALTADGYSRVEAGRPIAGRILQEHFSALDQATARIFRESIHVLRTAALDPPTGAAASDAGRTAR